MIIVGVYAKELSSTDIGDALCSACGMPLTMTISQRCFHVFAIPLIPLDKFAVVQCPRCRLQAEGKNLPAEMAEKIALATKEARTSPVFFTGIVLILLGVLYYNIHEFIQGIRTSDYMADPKTRDLYILPISGDKSFPYVICQVNAVTSDSITMAIGTMGYHSESDAEKAIDKGKHEGFRYFIEEYTVPRAQIATITEKVKEEGDVTVLRPGE